MSDEAKPELMKQVRILGCTAGHADHAGVGVPIGIIRLLRADGVKEHPLMLGMDDVMKLLRGLLDTLEYHDQPLLPGIMDVIRSGDLSLRQGPRPERRPTVRPSTRPDTPTKPFTDAEAKRLIGLFGTAENDADLLKRVGVPKTEIETKKTYKKYPRKKKQ